MPTTPALTPIRIVIADDHALFRQGLFSFIENTPSFTVVGQASNGLELIDVVDEYKPDLVLTDIQMPVMDGVCATEKIIKNHPHTGVIALSTYDYEQYVLQMIAAGARGYLFKNAESTEIIYAIKRVSNNENYYPPALYQKLLKHITHSKKTGYTIKSPSFTEKEILVMKMICHQHCTKEIAVKLNSTVRSVESARERIQNKIGARNMIGIVVYALECGIVSLPEISNESDFRKLAKAN